MSKSSRILAAVAAQLSHGISSPDGSASVKFRIGSGVSSLGCKLAVSLKSAHNRLWLL